MSKRTYVVHMPETTISAAKTLIQVAGGAGAEVYRANLSQNSTTTQEMLGVQMLRKSATATGTAFTPLPLNIDDSAFGANSLYNATDEGTDSSIIVSDNWNVVTTWSWVAASREDRIVVSNGDFFALKLIDAPSAGMLMTASIYFIG